MFTHEVHLPFRALRSTVPSIRATERLCAVQEIQVMVSNSPQEVSDLTRGAEAIMHRWKRRNKAFL
jgi:hypothetical protein